MQTSNLKSKKKHIINYCKIHVSAQDYDSNLISVIVTITFLPLTHTPQPFNNLSILFIHLPQFTLWYSKWMNKFNIAFHCSCKVPLHWPLNWPSPVSDWEKAKLINTARMQQNQWRDSWNNTEGSLTFYEYNMQTFLHIFVSFSTPVMDLFKDATGDIHEYTDCYELHQIKHLCLFLPGPSVYSWTRSPVSHRTYGAKSENRTLYSGQEMNYGTTWLGTVYRSPSKELYKATHKNWEPVTLATTPAAYGKEFKLPLITKETETGDLHISTLQLWWAPPTGDIFSGRRGRTLKTCFTKLVGVYTNIFSISLAQALPHHFLESVTTTTK